MNWNISTIAAWLEPVMLVAMVSVFVLTCVSVYWPGRRKQIEQPGLIPFKEDA